MQIMIGTDMTASSVEVDWTRISSISIHFSNRPLLRARYFVSTGVCIII